MHKGKKFYVLLAVVACVVVGVAVYFTMRPDNGYRSAIPRDAKAVMVIDMSHVAQSLGFTMRDLMLHYDKISQAGVDFTLPVYGFISKEGFMGIVAPLSDDDKLDAKLHDMGFETESRRGMMWCNVGSFLLVHDDEKLLVMGPSSLTQADAMYDQMAALMIQGSSDSNILVSLDEQPGDIKYFSHADVLPPNIAHYIMEQLPEGADLATVQVAASVQVTNRKVTFETNLNFEDKRLEDYFMEYNRSFRPITGNLLNMAPADPVVWMCANVDGDRHLDLLHHYKRMRSSLALANTQIDADQIVNAVDGDVSVSIPILSMGGLHGLLLAELKDTVFTDDATLEFSGNGWTAGMCPNYDKRKGKLFYVSNDDNLAKRAGRVGISENYRMLKQEIVGCVFFASVNLSKILYAISPYAMLLGTNSKMYETLESLNRLNIKMTDLTHFSIELTLSKDLRDLLL